MVRTCWRAAMAQFSRAAVVTNRPERARLPTWETAPVMAAPARPVRSRIFLHAPTWRASLLIAWTGSSTPEFRYALGGGPLQQRAVRRFHSGQSKGPQH